MRSFNFQNIPEAAADRFVELAEEHLTEAGHELGCDWRQKARQACELIGEKRQGWIYLNWVLIQAALIYFLRRNSFIEEARYVQTLDPPAREPDGGSPKISPDTADAYQKRAADLLARASESLGISWQEHPLGAIDQAAVVRSGVSRPTWRQYRAALVYFFLSSGNDLAAAYAYDKSTAPCLRRGAGTSAKKRKGIPEDDCRTLLDGLMKREKAIDYPVLLWLLAGERTGLRPSEWRGARLKGRELIAHNGKHSNGRAFGPTRTLDLSRLSKEDFEVVESFLEVLRHEGDFRKFYGRVRTRLRRWNQKLWPKRKKNIALYSARHQFAADNKVASTSPEVLAALMGHASTRTATRHYARKNVGRRRSGGVKPSVQDVQAVQALNPEPITRAPPASNDGVPNPSSKPWKPSGS